MGKPQGAVRGGAGSTVGAAVGLIGAVVAEAAESIAGRFLTEISRVPSKLTSH
jgi:hypothetical protein